MDEVIIYFFPFLLPPILVLCSPCLSGDEIGGNQNKQTPLGVHGKEFYEGIFRKL